MSVSILTPQVDNVTITPNPVNANTSFLIQVSVSEAYVAVDAIPIYPGSFYAGDDVDIIPIEY